jgi:hypothetical protein
MGGLLIKATYFLLWLILGRLLLELGVKERAKEKEGAEG